MWHVGKDTAQVGLWLGYRARARARAGARARARATVRVEGEGEGVGCRVSAAQVGLERRLVGPPLEGLSSEGFTPLQCCNSLNRSEGLTTVHSFETAPYVALFRKLLGPPHASISAAD